MSRDSLHRYYVEHKEELKQKRRLRYQSNKKIERARNKLWDEQHPGYHDNYNKLHYLQNREKRKEESISWKLGHPDRVYAGNAARWHIVLADVCEICGSSSNLERHHPDYSEPLVVVTVCRSCHRYIHNEGFSGLSENGKGRPIGEEYSR